MRTLIHMIVLFVILHPPIPQDSATVQVVDYYRMKEDKLVAQIVFNRERYHLSKDFWSYYRNGNYNASIGDLKYILKWIPNHPKALQLLEGLSLITNQRLLAVEYYQKALSLFPQYAITRAQYGAYLVRIGEVDSGIEQLNQALKISPELALTSAYLASSYLKAGKSDMAKQFEQDARRLGYQGDLPVLRIEENIPKTSPRKR